MTTILGIIIRVVLQGFLFWGVLKVFDRDNTRNTLPMAFVMGFAMSFGGWGILGLVIVGYLLVQYYEMEFGEMILFLLLFFAITWLIGFFIGQVMV